MSNFLEDFIKFKKEENVVRSQYGILDKKTGEHLVPVKNAKDYFGDKLVEITSKPNAGSVVEAEPVEPMMRMMVEEVPTPTTTKRTRKATT